MNIKDFLLGYEAGAAQGGGGGGGGTIVAKRGSFQASGTSETITHGLGVVPLVVFYWVSGAKPTNNNETYIATGFSQAVADALGSTTDVQYGVTYNTYNSIYAKTSPDYVIETTEDGDVLMHSATDTTIVLGGRMGKLHSGLYYDWLAVGLK